MTICSRSKRIRFVRIADVVYDCLVPSWYHGEESLRSQEARCHTAEVSRDQTTRDGLKKVLKRPLLESGSDHQSGNQQIFAMTELVTGMHKVTEITVQLSEFFIKD